VSLTLYDTLAPVSLTEGRVEATLAGTTFANRYDILELLGVGGMGAVYRARDRELDELVALKVIRRELAVIPDMVGRFRHEVKLARRVTHVNVARTFELGSAEDGTLFCTMELIDGESLKDRLKRGPLPIGEAVTIACAVCEGLATAHTAGVFHRDIKPDNILIAHDNRVVLADFGVAALGGGEGELAGTLAYMAPEQARGEPAAAAADVYALGVVLYEMLVGRNPFDGTIAQVIAAKQSVERLTPPPPVPPALADVIATSTQRDANSRTASVAMLRRALMPWTEPLGRVSLPVMKPPAASDLATVVVLAPASSADARQYLLTAVHEQVIARLSKTPRLRVLPRVAVAESEKPTFVLRFTLGTQLGVSLTVDGGATFEMSFPVGVDRVHSTADAVAAAVDLTLSRPRHQDKQLQDAFDLFLQARHLAYRDITAMPEAIDRLKRARALSPDDPRIAATLAIAYIRLAFFMPANVPDALSEARTLAAAAVAKAPDLADGHIALGHLALTAATPIHAASHFRMAISRAPQLAEAHEQLGRMLLEAGYIDLAMARLDDALAIAPDLRSAHWELSRAFALEGRWDEADRRIAAQIDLGVDRPLSRARYAWWRKDWDVLRLLRGKIGNMDRLLWPGTIDALVDLFLGARTWDDCKDALLSTLHQETPNMRRRVFVSQLACEAAAFVGQEEAVVSLLEHAAAHGLFDLHWLEKCPLLQPYRAVPGVVAVHAVIKQRAEAILDALYGDHGAGMSSTQAGLLETQPG